MTFVARLQLFLFGGFFLVLSGWFATMLLASENYQIKSLGATVSVPAVITTVDVDSSEQMVNSEGQSHMQTMYEGKVSYKYQYNHVDYEGTRVAMDTFTSGVRAIAASAVSQFKVGQNVQAWIDPNKPGDAVLQRSIGLGVYAAFGMVSIFMLFGGSLVLLAIMGLSERATATPVQQIIFDMPVVIWSTVNLSQLISFYSHSSFPYTPWSYVLVALWLALTGFLVRLRLIGRGLAPAFGNNASRGRGMSFETTGGSRNPGNRGNKQDSSFSVQGFGKKDGPAAAHGATMGGARSSDVDGAMIAANLSPVQRRIFKFGGAIPIILFIAFNAYRLSSFTSSMDERNPELTGVYSKEKAIADIPMHDADVARESDNVWAYKQRGTNYFDAGMYEKAIPDLTKTVTETKPPNDEALIARARCYNLTGQWSKALADYATYQKNYHKPFDKYFAARGLGLSHYHLGKFADAEKDFTTALKVEEDAGYGGVEKAELLHDRALCYDHLGKADLAAKDRKDNSSKGGIQWWLK